MNDLPEASNRPTSIIFADDTNLLLSYSNHKNLFQTANRDKFSLNIQNINSFTQYQKLTIYNSVFLHLKLIIIYFKTAPSQITWSIAR